MVVGVNGAGKTTSIGKLTRHLAEADQKVLLAAADTFRAAAREQLAVWAGRNQVEIVSQEGGDPAAVSFDAVSGRPARGCDVVIADTAGRLPTQAHLMEELKKIQRTIAKAQAGAPHEVLLVVDGNTGQNALAQVKAFDAALGLTGLIVTKLDGTAKGGVLAAIARWGARAGARWCRSTSSASARSSRTCRPSTRASSRRRCSAEAAPRGGARQRALAARFEVVEEGRWHGLHRASSASQRGTVAVGQQLVDLGHRDQRHRPRRRGARRRAPAPPSAERASRAAHVGSGRGQLVLAPDLHRGCRRPCSTRAMRSWRWRLRSVSLRGADVDDRQHARAGVAHQQVGAERSPRAAATRRSECRVGTRRKRDSGTCASTR